MRLINVDTRELGEFQGSNIPPYAILSHTWEAGEVTFADFQDGRSSWKIDGVCKKASTQKLGWVWIDTCCIDKSSSAELSESINSMFTWYKRADICFVYLADVPPGDRFNERDSRFHKSRWFTRGWTLQELLAPLRMEFYDNEWNCIHGVQRTSLQPSDTWTMRGYKNWSLDADNASFLQTLTQITGIDNMAFTTYYDLIYRRYSVAQKMSWASVRETTRTEDRAYSLLGLFKVNMPMMYGEGSKAFVRLQEEILKNNDDQSIFSWGYRQTASIYGGLLAKSPRAFHFCDHVRKQTATETAHYFLTNKGLRMETRLTPVQPTLGPLVFALINCTESRSKYQQTLAIPLYRFGGSAFRPGGAAPISLPLSMFKERATQLYINTSESLEDFEADTAPRISRLELATPPVEIRMSLPGVKFWRLEVYPPSWQAIWDPTIGPREVLDMELVVIEEQKATTRESPATADVWLRFYVDDHGLDDFVLRLQLEWFHSTICRRKHRTVSVLGANSKTVRHAISVIPKQVSLFEQICAHQHDGWSQEVAWNEGKLKSILKVIGDFPTVVGPVFMPKWPIQVRIVADEPE